MFIPRLRLPDGTLSIQIGEIGLAVAKTEANRRKDRELRHSAILDAMPLCKHATEISSVIEEITSVT